MPDGSTLSVAIVADQAAPGRRILMLQGLMGPFFDRLARGFRRHGHAVHKVHFNGGDRLFWRGPATDYTGSLAAWPAALEAILDERGITDVVLFGDCRLHHRAAISVCKARHLPVHVFEEGYVRPDWVTFELGGVNALSSLPRDSAHYLAAAAILPPPPAHPPLPSSFRRRAVEGVLYNAADILTRRYYRHWTNHRPWHPVTEGLGWLRRLSRSRAARRRTVALLDHLADSRAPYVLFTLQLDADAQIRLHSDFSGMAGALATVISSFARAAPAGLRLVVKEHPLDNGLTDWRKLTARLASHHGVADRVDYLEGGDIALVVRPARGLVTINSTTGTLAAAHGVPTVTLGHAVYGIEGIVHTGSLDRFWTEPTPPDPAVFAAFRRVLIERCLVPGGFFSNAALDTLVAAAIARFEGRHGGDPLALSRPVTGVAP